VSIWGYNEPFDPGMRRNFLICLALASLTWAALWPIVGNGFVNFDDPAYIYENGRVQAGLNWDNVKWAFSTGYFGNWHPMTWLSHMLDVQLFGLDAGLHHLHSLGLHTGSVLLLFLALQRMTRAVWASAFAAALFAVHPLRVESVAWAAERKDVLSVFFGVCAIWAYARYVEQSTVHGTQSTVHTPVANGSQSPPTSHVPRFTFHAALFYLLSLSCFALALMSKAMLVTLPFALLLLDYWPLGRFCRLESTVRSPQPTVRGPCSAFVIWEKLPFFMLSIASAATGFLLLRHAGAITEGSAFGIGDRVGYMAYGYLGYLAKVICPINLVLPYPRPPHVPASMVLSALAIGSLGSGLALALVGRRPYLVVGWFWFVGCLLPVSGLVSLGPQALADRYTYFPSIGLCIAFAWGMADLARTWRWRPAISGSLAAALLTACVLASHRQTAYWHDSESLYRHGLAVNGDNCVAHNGLGHELFRQGKVDEAIRECEDAVRIDPRYDPAYSNLGRFFAEKRDYAAAITNLETAISLSPRDTKPRNNLGNVFYLQGRYPEAKAQFTEALRLDPGHTDALNNLGLVCEKLGQPGEAIRSFRQAIALRPDFVAAVNNLAWLLATCPDGQYRDGAEAVRLATQACELTRYANPNTLATLAAAYAEAGQVTDAIGLAEQAQARVGEGPGELKERLGAMIRSFRAHAPYREK
jgi:protein O-mannosyl-transferase